MLNKGAAEAVRASLHCITLLIGLFDLATNDSLSSTEQLELQQLLQLDFWERQFGVKQAKEHELSSDNEAHTKLPGQWELTRGIELHAWQRQCVDAWFQAGMRGVLKVVTGAGKTILALAIAERLQRVKEPNLRVAIVVPTVVLLNQWKFEISSRGNIPPEAIGLLGGGFDDTFDSDKRILICVLNSAARKLPDIVAQSEVGSSLLLIVDECHRAGAREMRRIFETSRAFSLGLSATPEREADPSDDEDWFDSQRDEADYQVNFDETAVGRGLGSVIFELNYAEAIGLGVLPPFDIIHCGLSLLPPERAKYDRISRDITALRQDLEKPGRRGLGLIRWCRSSAAASNPAAARLLGLTAERKRLLFQMSQRTRATVRILRDAFADNPSSRAILFHESIEQVMELFASLRADGFPVVAEHSKFPDSMRSEALQLFREGTAQIIVSARSLIEGFNVPSADLGIVVAASSSVRQRVQTLGRLLRKTRAKDGQEKRASLYVLYAADTVDELIYEKADWEKFVGAERNAYFLWSDVDQSKRIEVGAPPRRPAIGEIEIQEDQLHVGDTYPGDTDEGQEYSRDSTGTIRTVEGLLVELHQELASTLKASRKAAGRFRITPQKRFVVELDKTEDGWRGVYLGALSSPVVTVQPGQQSVQQQRDWRPGDLFPLDQVLGKTFSVLQRDPRLIARKEKGQAHFVVPDGQILDVGKRRALSDLRAFLKKAYQRGHRISKITVTRHGHVVYVFNNRGVFAGWAPEGSEGFIFEA